MAAAPFIPTTTETLVIPAGSAGPRGAGGQVLAAPATITFTVAQASTERLQQLLAQLGYLPVTFTPKTPLSSAGPGHDRPGGDVQLALARHPGVAHLTVDRGRGETSSPRAR